MTADWLVAFMLRASILLALALLLAHATRQRPASLRRLVLATAICGALAMPLLSALLPAWHVPLPSPRAGAPRPAPAVAAADVVVDTTLLAPRPATSPTGTAQRPAWPLRQWLALVWLTGAAACALPLLIGLGRLRMLFARSTAITTGRWASGPAELAGSDACSPATRRPGPPSASRSSWHTKPSTSSGTTGCCSWRPSRFGRSPGAIRWPGSPPAGSVSNANAPATTPCSRAALPRRITPLPSSPLPAR